MVTKRLLAAGANVNLESKVCTFLTPFAVLSPRRVRNGCGRQVVCESPDEGGGCGVQDGRTALYMAAKNGHIWVTKKLLAAGANVNVQSKVRTHIPLTALSPRQVVHGSPADEGWVWGAESMDCAALVGQERPHSDHEEAAGCRGERDSSEQGVQKSLPPFDRLDEYAAHPAPTD